MSTIRVDLESIQVIDGQGVSEGDFELRVQVQEGSNQVTWPSAQGSVKVDKNGPPHPINRQVARYPVNSGTLSKRYSLAVTEVDGGVNGKDDIGSGAITFDLKPNMTAQTKSVDIPLKRPNMKFEGKVRVFMAAQVA